MASSPLMKENRSREQVAAEVVELGEAIFDALIEQLSYPATIPKDDQFPVQEVSEASHQFFTALRLLLKLEEP